ncbi:alpha/beta hydrolase [Pontibacter sp. CAU 1760]
MLKTKLSRYTSCCCFVALVLTATFSWHKGFAQKSETEIPLYRSAIPNEIPGPDEESVSNEGGKIRISKVRKPTLSVFLPPKGKATGTAVLICPGGGYSILASGHEGYDVAREFSKRGIAAFVLKYRLPNPATSSHPELAPLQDAQRAMQLIHENAEEWQIKPDKIGIMGFSAGGHLASTVGTHFDKTYVEDAELVNMRPDFMILAYPVISNDTAIWHKGSFEKLLGTNPTAELSFEFSNEKQVTAQTPATFLMHAKDDQAVPIANSRAFYDTLIKNRVSAEIFTYPKGGHGFGLHNPTSGNAWFEHALNWMKRNKF